jgi:hypothetical protein
VIIYYRMWSIGGGGLARTGCVGCGHVWGLNCTEVGAWGQADGSREVCSPLVHYEPGLNIKMQYIYIYYSSNFHKVHRKKDGGSRLASVFFFPINAYPLNIANKQRGGIQGINIILRYFCLGIGDIWNVSLRDFFIIVPLSINY